MPYVAANCYYCHPYPGSYPPFPQTAPIQPTIPEVKPADVKQEGEDSFDDFLCRFQNLISEAKRHGVHAVVVLHEYNPISDETSFRFGFSGGKELCIGLLEQAKDRVLHPEEED